MLSCNQMSTHLHLRTLAECLGIERLLWSYSKLLLRVSTIADAGIILGYGHQVTVLRSAWKGVLFYHIHAWFCFAGESAWALCDLQAQEFSTDS